MKFLSWLYNVILESLAKSHDDPVKIVREIAKKNKNGHFVTLEIHGSKTRKLSKNRFWIFHISRGLLVQKVSAGSEIQHESLYDQAWVTSNDQLMLANITKVDVVEKKGWYAPGTIQEGTVIVNGIWASSYANQLAFGKPQLITMLL